ncbi:MAG: glycosyltransferase [Enterococcus hulanensis]
MKKKVLLISESMGGGLRKHVVQLINCLDKQKYELYFIHGTKTTDAVFLEEYEGLKRNATVIPCESFTREIDLKNDLKTLCFIMKKIKEIEPDIVHCHSSKAGAIGRLAAKKEGIKKIFYTPHAYSFLAPEFSDKKKQMFIFIERFLSRYATCLTFCVSEGEKKEALKHKVDVSKKFKVIYNGLPEVDFFESQSIKEELGLSPDTFLVGNNARMSEQKNPILFFEIAKQLSKLNDNYHFVWAGEGPLYEQVRCFIEDNNLKNKTHLLGDRSDSEYLVKGYDLFLITSKYEGFPYAPIEALRAGVPVTGTHVNGISEVIVENINGYSFDPNNIYRAVQVIDNLFNDRTLINREKILNSYEENFSQKEMIQKIETFYLGEL